MIFDKMRCVVEPGSGVVGRWPGSIALFLGSPALLEQFLVGRSDFSLPSLLEAAAEMDWDAAGGGFGAIIADKNSVRVRGEGACDVLFGKTRSSVGNARLRQALTPSDRIGLLDRRLPIPDLNLGLNQVLALAGGVVPGAGVVLGSVRKVGTAPDDLPAADFVDRDPTIAIPVVTHPPTLVQFPIDEPPETAVVPLPVREYVNGGSVSSMNRRTPQAIAPAGAGVDAPGSNVNEVRVHGLHCSRRHFNHPEAQHCMICGVSIPQVRSNLVAGIRPTLGYIVQDDGTSYHLSHGYLIGRSPEPEPSLGLIILRDDGVSRNHAKIMLDDWNVVIMDTKSTNGTRYRSPYSDQWINLVPDEPVVLEPGSAISLGGGRTFSYEAVHKLGH